MQIGRISRAIERARARNPLPHGVQTGRESTNVPLILGQLAPGGEVGVGIEINGDVQAIATTAVDPARGGGRGGVVSGVVEEVHEAGVGVAGVAGGISQLGCRFRELGLKMWVL
jgi:hypothetical protein